MGKTVQNGAKQCKTVAKMVQNGAKRCKMVQKGRKTRGKMGGWTKTEVGKWWWGSADVVDDNAQKLSQRFACTVQHDRHHFLCSEAVTGHPRCR